MRSRLLVAMLAALFAIGVYLAFFRGPSEVEPRVRPARATAVIGTGADAVGVSARGDLLTSEPPPEPESLPSLPLSEPPPDGRLGGPVLAQALVLGSAPAPLRACIAGSRYGETGIDVELRSGIELFFGDDSQVAEKWQSAVAMLADPSITALDYVDLHSPRRPSVGGSGHTLPPPEAATAGGCGP